MLVCVCLETYVGYRLHVLVATGEANRGHDDAQYIRDSRDSIEGQCKLQRVGRVGPEDIHRVFCYVKTMPWWVACFREQRPGSSVKTSSVEVPAGDQPEL